MCLFVWVASSEPVPLAPLADPQKPDPVDGYHAVLDVSLDAPVRARLSLSHVRSVGSHEGCGCGFNSDEFTWQGFARADEVAHLAGAMSPDEREAFASEQRSRALLRALVERALAAGDVEVYGCWAGDEAVTTEATEAVEPAWFTERLAPIAERVLYRVRRPDRA